MPKRNHYNYASRSKANSILLLFPLFLIVTVLPLIVSMHSYNTGLSQFDWYPEHDLANDFFLYYKQWFFVFISSLCVLVLIIRSMVHKTEIKFHKIFIPLALYAILALISTLVSPYRDFGFSGMFEQFENVFCLLGYALIVYYAFCIIQSEAELKLLINALAIGALILGLIGTLQAFGYDIFNTTLGRTIIVEKNIDPNSIKFEFENRTYATLYNPNYVGLYTSMIIPLYTVLLFYTKFGHEFILYILVIVLNFVSMFGSQSKSGIISIFGSILVTILIMRKKIVKKWFIALPILACASIAFIGLNHIQNNTYINAIKNVFKTSSNVSPALTEISTEKDHIKVIYNNNTLFVKLDSMKLSFYDDSNNIIPIKDVANSEYPFVLDDNRFLDISLVVVNNEFADFGLIIEDKPWYFKYDDAAKQFYHYNQYGRLSPINTAPSAVFTGHERFASNRGYIWSRTFPILSNYIILGSGADTFGIVFPQYDYVNSRNYGFEGTLITKPHSLYLQTAVQTGFISLLALLVFYYWYFIQSIKLYFNNSYNTPTSVYGMAIFISSISFMISAISNDSSITVSPVFWCCIGTGLAANTMIQKTN